MTEAIDQLITILVANWNTTTYPLRGHSSVSTYFKNIIATNKQIKPQVANNDYFYLYDLTEQHNFPTLSQQVSDVEANITLDMRTNTLVRANKMKNETIRVLKSQIVSVGGGWHRLTFTDVVNRSNKAVGLFKYIMQVTMFKEE